MVKSLPKVVYHGLKVFAVSIRKSVLQEIELSRELAKIRYQDNIKQKTNKVIGSQMCLDEAQKVLNIEKLDSKEIEDIYQKLFSANKGNLYLQSKVFRAKEAIDLKMSQAKAELAEKKKDNTFLERNSKYLLLTYVLLNEK